MSKRVYVDHLKQVELFDSFTRRDLERVATVADHVSVKAGTVIIEQDTLGHDAYVVLSGTVLLKRNGRKVAELGPGSILGELALLDHGPRTARAECVTDCDLLILSRGTFMGVIDDVPELAHKLMFTLAHRLRELDTHSYG
jgi:CRP/FNR family cyclic AMP-dependent transcriptional regulator